MPHELLTWEQTLLAIQAQRCTRHKTGARASPLAWASRRLALNQPPRTLVRDASCAALQPCMGETVPCCTPPGQGIVYKSFNDALECAACTHHQIQRLTIHSVLHLLTMSTSLSAWLLNRHPGCNALCHSAAPYGNPPLQDLGLIKASPRCSCVPPFWPRVTLQGKPRRCPSPCALRSRKPCRR